MTSRCFALSTLLFIALPAGSVFAQQPADPTLSATEPAAMAQAFQMTTLRTSQPQIFAVIADRALGVAIKNAVMPALFGEDSTFVASRSSSAIRRATDAAARTVAIRNGPGRFQLNISEVGGAGIAAGLSNLYRPAGDRSVTATLSRWATQLLADTVSNELREFWPDVRRAFHKP